MVSNKTLLVVCLLAAAAVAASAHERSLLQGLFNCGGIKQVSGKCCQLCWCIGDQSDKKSLAGDSIQKYCRDECEKCAKAGSDSKVCPSDSAPLPEVCSKGLQFNSAVKSLVDKCLDIYRNDKDALSKAKGC